MGDKGSCRKRGLQCRGKDSGQTTARAVRGLWLPAHHCGVDSPVSVVKEMRKLKPRNQLGRGSDQGHAVKQLAGKGEERPKNTLQSRHVPPPQTSSCQAEARKGVGPGRELAQVTPSPSNPRPPHTHNTPRRWQIGPGRAAAMGQQRAQECHGCRRRRSTEAALRRTALRARKSHRGTVACVALGPAPSPACGNTRADLPAHCWGPSAPTLDSGMVRLSVR